MSDETHDDGSGWRVCVESGPVTLLVGGRPLDDVLDTPAMLYRIDGRLSKRDIAELAFAAGRRAAQHEQRAATGRRGIQR